MDELQRLIVQEFGEMVLRIPNLLETGLSYPLDESQAGVKGHEICGMFNETKAIALWEVVEKMDGSSLAGNTPYDVGLALRLFSHNLDGEFLGYLTLATELQKNKFFRMEKSLNIAIRNLINCRLLGQATAYLASSGSPFSADVISINQLEFLLNYFGEKKATVAGDHNGVISSPEYLALCQMVSNVGARRNVIVDFERNGENASLSATDNGPGIRDIDGHPLPEDRLHEIFYGITTKTSGGLGLQVVRRLAQLRGGYVNVTTKTEGNKPISYSTLFGQIPAEKFDGSSGTRFAIHYHV